MRVPFLRNDGGATPQYAGKMMHVQTFFLFVAFCFLMSVCLTSPYRNKYAFYQVKGYGHEVFFGAFGYCDYSSAGAKCTGIQVGYDVAAILKAITGHSVGGSYSNTTGAFVLLGISAALALIGIPVSSLSTRFPLVLVSAVLSTLTFVFTFVALVCEWASFAFLGNELEDNTSARGHKKSAHWLLFFTMLLLLCCPPIAAKQWMAMRTRHTMFPVAGQYAPPA